MARAALGWSLDDLAKTSGVARRSIARFEAGESVKPGTMESLRAAMVAEGVEFINGGKRVGVAVRQKD